METEKLQISLAPGAERADITIREVAETNELKIKAPIVIAILGILACVFEFLSKRISETDQINQKRSHVLVDRKAMSIELITDEHDAYKRGSVKGKLEYHHKFLEFGINDLKYDWAPNDLGQFFRMNRAFFPNRADNMELVSKLKSFEATVNIKMEKETKENGSFKDNYSGLVNSNLPEGFKLLIPLFKGYQPEEIEVEFAAMINGRNVFLQLVSPGANQAVEEIRDKAIDEQLEKIRALAPDIAILEI